jgi:hypothetical protein
MAYDRADNNSNDGAGLGLDITVVWGCPKRLGASEIVLAFGGKVG